LPEFRRLKETAPAVSACFKRISAALILNKIKKAARFLENPRRITYREGYFPCACPLHQLTNIACQYILFQIIPMARPILKKVLHRAI
jgi:hypothetical protein